jgi:hypothetical protein
LPGIRVGVENISANPCAPQRDLLSGGFHFKRIARSQTQFLSQGLGNHDAPGSVDGETNAHSGIKMWLNPDFSPIASIWQKSQGIEQMHHDASVFSGAFTTIDNCYLKCDPATLYKKAEAVHSANRDITPMFARPGLHVNHEIVGTFQPFSVTASKHMAERIDDASRYYDAVPERTMGGSLRHDDNDSGVGPFQRLLFAAFGLAAGNATLLLFLLYNAWRSRAAFTQNSHGRTIAAV